jgi:iron complex transport system substrate-binding protein
MPDVAPDARVVAVPIRRFSLGTYRYGRAAERLGVVDRLVAFANHTHSTVPEILALFDSGVLTRNADTEAVINRRSEAHFNWHFPAQLSRVDDTYARMGVPVVDMAEHLEPTPLARAEWVKFFAMFFNQEAAADRLFDDIERQYVALADTVRDLPIRPRVLVGTPQGDGWQVYGGRNVHARIIEDAGGAYLWRDHRGSESGWAVPFEEALVRARDADVWIIGPDASFGPRVAEITVDDPRYAYVPAVRDGRVFVANRRYPEGPNPWWDEALVNPHLELRDHIQMLHPDRVADPGLDDFTFYRRLRGVPRDAATMAR